MSKAGYKRNIRVSWTIRCTYTIDGKVRVHDFKGSSQSLTQCFNDAKNNHLWSKHPTFSMEVVGIDIA
jgi:hypothetical protein